ncbi:pentapeptide repeat-containing protein [Pandoraea sp. NPDC087047]|uniref:pentapeptide repeat-containing protein n=1 Tax=Pandoraea sp. NPDC087047 TaxID=3364390 RepID=UPI0038199DA5
MTLDHTAPTAGGVTVLNRTLGRADIEQLIEEARGPLHFEDCDFDDADLSRLNLRGATFERCAIAQASFLGAALVHTHWIKCRARQADFRSADLVDAVFRSSDLNNTNWRRAKLGAVHFRGCKLTGANFEDCATLGLEFDETLLVGAHLRRVSFRKTTLRNLDFSDADLAGADFRDAVFEGGSLRNAHLRDTLFEGADLRGVDLHGVRLIDAGLFRGATISYEQAAELVTELGLRVV